MATAMPTNRHVNDIIHTPFSVEKISKDKKYRDQKKQEIISIICALLNTNGGEVEFRGEETEGNFFTTTIIDSLIRTLEQSLQSRLGAHMLQFIKFNEFKSSKMIMISVSKAPFLVTIKYNLYRPTQKQIELVGNVRNALEIMDARNVKEPVKLDSHNKTFHEGKQCDLVENEVIQFKLLKSVSSKHVTLADRMVGKSNKFGCYVSGFANHRGGHIYYGIDNNGIAQGENTENISDIEKKVEKAIQKMIWPDRISQPKRGEHWEIFFEPVLDEKSNLIPSTFVIVIFIAPCFGGVFTEKPESCEIVEGEVERMSFTTWKEKLQPSDLKKRKQEVPSTKKPISLSPEAKKLCTEVNEVLTAAINNLKWESFAESARHFEQKYPGKSVVKFIVFSRKMMADYRRGNELSSLVSEYQESFLQTEEPFGSLFNFSEKVITRVSGNAAESQDVVTDALTIAEMLEPGLLTAAVLLIAASIYDSQIDAESSLEELCSMALDHLKYVKDAPTTQADMFHVAHIILAIYHLGYDLSGKVVKEDIDRESFQKAQARIMAVNQSEIDGSPRMPYREIWFKLAHSMLYIRRSQLEPEKQTKFLNDALNYAKSAENLAKDSGLVKIVCWAQALDEHISRLSVP